MSASARPFQRRLLLNTASTAMGNLWAIVVALVTLPLLLRGLGRDAFGTWVLLQTFSAITGWLSLLDLGVGTAATRAVAQRSAVDDVHGIGNVVSSSFVIFATLGTGCAALLATVGPVALPALFRTPDVLRSDLRFAIVAFAVQVALDQVTEGIEATFEGLQRVDLSRATDALRRTVVAAATCVVALAGGGLRGVAVASLIASAVGTAGGLLLLHRCLVEHGVRGRSLHPSVETGKDLFRYGRTVAVLRPLGVLHRTMDRVVAGAVLGPGAVTLVEIATQVQNGADAILSASAYAVSPSATWLHSRGDEDKLRDLLARGTRLSLLVTLPVVAATGMLAGPLITLWVGDRYREAAGLAALALLYVALTAPLQVGSNLLIGTGRAGDILRAASIAVVVNLGASVILVHVIGIAGVFVGTLTGTTALIPLLGRVALREVGLGVGAFIRESVFPVVPPTIGMVVAIALVRLLDLGDIMTIVVGAIVGGGTFAALSLRWAMPPAQVRDLLASLRRGEPVVDDDGAGA